MKKIWIVDDDEDMARAVMLMLKLLDCEARHFLSARLAGKALLDGRLGGLHPRRGVKVRASHRLPKDKNK